VESTKWWSKFFLVTSMVAVVLLFASPIGYKYGVAELMPSFASLLLALTLAVIVFVGGLIMTVVANRKGLIRDRQFLLVAVAISLIPMIAMGPPIAKVRSVPPIHDISTDGLNPPTFDVVIGLRAEAPNDLEYGSEQDSAAALAKLQQAAYPQIVTLESDLSVPEAVAQAALVLAQQGLEVVNVDVDNGRVEAVATTFWFGFKDDLVVRIQPTHTGSKIDVRSVSRVGQSDLGANAARIAKFLQAFDQ
jgi:uncharacterized protein (DUF1499 family)